MHAGTHTAHTARPRPSVDVRSREPSDREVADSRDGISTASLRHSTALAGAWNNRLTACPVHGVPVPPFSDRETEPQKGKFLLEILLSHKGRPGVRTSFPAFIPGYVPTAICCHLQKCQLQDSRHVVAFSLSLLRVGGSSLLPRLKSFPPTSWPQAQPCGLWAALRLLWVLGCLGCMGRDRGSLPAKSQPWSHG